MKTIAMYSKGSLWGGDGYSINIGNTDARFFFGKLAEAKKAALEAFHYTAKEVEWKRYDKPETLTYDRAIEILLGRGWDKDGAEAIVNTLVEDGMLDSTTEDSLIALSDDYADR